MQAHTQQEFGASLNQGVSTAERLEDSGWLKVRCVADPDHDKRSSFYVDGRTPKDKANDNPDITSRRSRGYVTLSNWKARLFPPLW